MIQEPTQPTLTPNTTTRPRPQRIGGVRIELIIAAIILLAIPVVMAVANNFAPVSSPLAIAGASAAPDTTNNEAPKGPKADKGPKGGKGGGPGGHITIKSISGSSLQLGTVDGWSRVINVTSTTVITKGGQTIAVGDLKVGDEIHFRQMRNADGSFSIVAIDVPTPHAGGTVTKVDGNDITVSKKDGTTQVITVTGSTVYKLGPAAGSKSDVKVGTNIDAAGTVSGTTFTALSVNVRLAHLDGEVTAKTSSSITVKDRSGATKTIHVTGTTAYKLPGAATSSLSDIKVGDRVGAEGTLRSDGSLDAVAVHTGHGKGFLKAPKPNSSAAPG